MIYTLRPHDEIGIQPLMLELFKTDILFLKLIIIDASGDPCILDNTINGYGPSYLDIKSDLKKICKSIIISDDFTYYYKPIEDVFYFPYGLWLSSTRNIHKYYDYQDTVYDTDLEKTHPLMCLNRNLVWHRIYLLMLLHNKPWLDKIDFSFMLPMGYSNNVSHWRNECKHYCIYS